MNDKDFNDCLDKLLKATDRLSDVTERMGKTVSKMIDYCTIVTLVMFIIFIIAFIF